jgi:AraC family transcriptional regulator, arabinose operon regulatory protein
MQQARFVDWRLNRKAQTLSPPAQDLCRQHPLLADLFVSATGQITRGLGHHFERRTFDEFIVLYCVEGSGWLRAGTTTYPMHARDVGFVFTDLAHGYGADDHDPWSIHWAHFNGAHVPAFLDLIGVSPQKPITSLRADSRSDLVRHFNSMLSLLTVDHSLPHLLKASAYLRQILSSLVLVNSPPMDAAEEASVVDRVINFMHENITHTLQLDDLALKVNLSHSHLHRIFREETNQTPINYFIHLKIQRACELLDNTEMKVGEISDFLGYNDPHYFSRIFKQFTGYSPRRFRSLRRAGFVSVENLQQKES